ncbi:MAG: hypothetical protein NUK63_03330 [Candidatus Bathyarchaeum tardum]|nr:MAG: hypothetical protein NUK63_03330 [Candidatus Bathyarchaeum tardum]
MESALIVALVSAVLAIVSVCFGTKYRKLLAKARLFTNLLNKIISAVEDDNISGEELQQLITTSKELMESN